MFAALPAHTVVRDHPDRVLALADLAPAIAGAVQRLSEEVEVRENDDGEMRIEAGYATLDAGTLERNALPGKPSVYGCPECGGVLWELDDSENLRFRCRVGHAYTADGVVRGQEESIETALWTALRALQERAQLSERLAERVGSAGAERSRQRFEAVAAEARDQAETIRRLLAGPDGPTD
jgi:two-component system chemotaxis response regulator CheB